MLDHDTQGRSLILTDLENLAWPEKGALVVASETMLPGKTDLERLQAEKGSSRHHGPACRIISSSYLIHKRL
jgi:hypothetical protein